MERIRMSLKTLLCLGVLLGGFSLSGCSVLQSDELESCTEDQFCDDDSVCHPLAKVCVKSCESDSDCPENSRSCTGTSGTQKYCECESTEKCGGDEDIICTT